MLRKGITQFALADMTGYSQSHISKIMNGKDLYLSTAQEIASALGYRVDYIWPNYFHGYR
ncbi:Helix-turn-helix [Desulfosporosinus hippei DSM 8344]|uniref:Helix-turn-helix n=2 Tax=Desulfosporosinus TaxID=79206 RepID=A0A1G7UHP8_9FIRM|nr:Helix-turn-helix [Desulfosporosinus hippei DSM 8344]